jgi:hypothetical protein
MLQTRTSYVREAGRQRLIAAAAACIQHKYETQTGFSMHPKLV